MVYDPLADVVRPPPPERLAEIGMESADAQRARLEHERIELVVAARAFVGADRLAASLYAPSRMSPTVLREHAAVANVPDRRKIEDLDLRRVLVFIDARRVEQGLQPHAVEAVPHTLPPAPTDGPKPVKIARVPMSKTNQWKVTKTAPHVALPGGQFTLHAGTILDLVSYTEATIQSLAEQGVQLEAYPEAVERHTCKVCDVSWPAMLAPAHVCPGCELANVGQRMARDRAGYDESIAAAHATTESMREQLHALGVVHNRRVELHAGLIRWAVEQGALEPDHPEGTWQGEAHPPPLAHTLAARNPDAPPPASSAPEPVPAEVAPAALEVPAEPAPPPVADELAAVAVPAPEETAPPRRRRDR